MKKYVIAIDAGTTGITIILFNKKAQIVNKVYSEFKQIYPKPGWVEHNLDEIYSSLKNAVVKACQIAQKKDANFSKKRIATIGITNQRETLCFWEKTTGRQARQAIVWQCRRSSEVCRDLKTKGLERHCPKQPRYK